MSSRYKKTRLADPDGQSSEPLINALAADPVCSAQPLVADNSPTSDGLSGNDLPARLSASVLMNPCLTATRQASKRLARKQQSQAISYDNFVMNSAEPHVSQSAMTSRQSKHRQAFLSKRKLQTFSSASVDVPQASNVVVPESSACDDYVDLGDCDFVCEFCGAAFWFTERLRNVPLKSRPKYSMCCRGGRVKLCYPIHPPARLKDFFADKQFLANIRGYNSMFAMTSFGASIDSSINTGSSPYVFKVAGQVSHLLGSLCPPPNQKPRFLQLYIYDTDSEVSNHLNSFTAHENHALSPEVVHSLIDILDQSNRLVHLFRTARDICHDTHAPEFSIRLFTSSHKHPYGAPATDSLGAIVHDNGSNAKDFDIIIRSRDGTPQRVNNLHPCYMSLQYPLLFPFGEEGWTPELKLSEESSKDGRRLSMNMFYSYQIHDRLGCYTLLLNAGRLFQQYLVDAYISIERNRLSGGS
jgi:hypothetical protein